MYSVSRQFTLTQHIIPAQNQQQRQLSTTDPCSTMLAQFNNTVLLTDSYTATRVIKNGMTASLPLQCNQVQSFGCFWPQSIGRVLSFFSSRWNWDFPNLSPAGECAFPLWFREEGQTAGEKGDGRVPIPTRGHTCTYSSARHPDF